MYMQEVHKNGTTKHSRHCTGGFGRRDMKCHRCCELARGAKPRQGWQRKYFTMRQREHQRMFQW